MRAGVALAASICVALVIVAGLVGWVTPGAPQAPSLAVVRHPGAGAPSMQRPGAGLIADVDALDSDLAVPTAVPVTASPPPQRVVGLTPAPVVHDIAPVFRGRASAIVRLPNGRLAIWLAAQAGEGRGRLLRIGDPFDDGWRLAALTTSEATLTDGTKVERVPLFGEAPGGASGDPVP